MNKLKRYFKKIIDVLFSPFTLFATLWLKYIQTRGLHNFKLAEKIFMKVGVLPVVDHYYYPMINPRKHLRYSLRDDRRLPGINLNTENQVKLLNEFHYTDELLRFPVAAPEGNDKTFFYDNGWFDKGDAEILYSLIRKYKPSKIIEVGSGNSTLMALNAISKNKEENPAYDCAITCIEPYEMSWLETKKIKVIRQRVEELDVTLFDSLDANDILFIDSSHMVRPQGDVLFEILELLPRLNKNVIVHIHDIFTPKDYLDSWIIEGHGFWNEQYVLEAFLSMNKEYEIMLALNYLFYHHRDELNRACPLLAKNPAKEPRSIWIRRV